MRHHHHGPITCHCGSGLSPHHICARKGCEATGCAVCLKECGASVACGRFCADHRIDEIDGLSGVCLRCAGEICEVPEPNTNAAAGGVLQSAAAPVPETQNEKRAA